MDVTLKGSTPTLAGIDAMFNEADIALITDPALFFAIFGSHPPLESLPASQQLGIYSQFAAIVESTATSLNVSSTTEPKGT